MASLRNRLEQLEIDPRPTQTFGQIWQDFSVGELHLSYSPLAPRALCGADFCPFAKPPASLGSAPPPSTSSARRANSGTFGSRTPFASRNLLSRRTPDADLAGRRRNACKPVRAARGSLGLAVAIVATWSRFLARRVMSDAPVSRSWANLSAAFVNARDEDHLVDVLDEVGDPSKPSGRSTVAACTSRSNTSSTRSGPSRAVRSPWARASRFPPPPARPCRAGRPPRSRRTPPRGAQLRAGWSRALPRMRRMRNLRFGLPDVSSVTSRNRASSGRRSRSSSFQVRCFLRGWCVAQPRGALLRCRRTREAGTSRQNRGITPTAWAGQGAR